MVQIEQIKEQNSNEVQETYAINQLTTEILTANPIKSKSTSNAHRILDKRAEGPH